MIAKSYSVPLVEHEVDPGTMGWKPLIADGVSEVRVTRIADNRAELVIIAPENIHEAMLGLHGVFEITAP